MTDHGTEPDPRFTFANERTFLAWNRTALALMAAGLAVAQFLDQVGEFVQIFLSVAFIALGGWISIGSYYGWRQNQRALRMGQPLPRSLGPLYVVVGLVAIGATSALAAMISRLL